MCGRRAFGAGVAAYGKGDYTEAIARFSEALTYRWHPAIALNLGLAESRAGHYLDAIGDLDRVVASAESTARIKDQATRERDRASGELSLIEIDDGAEASTRVEIDGHEADAAAPSRVDPGAHHLDIRMPSGVTIRRDVTLAPRERLRLSIDRTHELVVVPAREREAPVASDVVPPRHGVSPLWLVAAAGATGALGAVTVWSALDTKSAHDDYERALPTASQAEINRRVDDGHGLETRTNVLLAVAGACALGTAALGLFVVDWGPSKARLALLPGAVSLAGRF